MAADSTSAKQKLGKVVLAYSGGLDTSIIIPWLKENYDCEVVAFAANVGQPDELGTSSRRRSPPAPASSTSGPARGVRDRLRLPDAPRRAIYEREYLLGTSIARPLIAQASRSRSRCATGCRRARARLHRQGQRSGALRADLPGARAASCRSSRRGASGTSSRARTRSTTPRRTASRCRSTQERSTRATATSGTSRTKAASSRIPSYEPRRDDVRADRRSEDAPDEPENVTIGFERACRSRSTARRSRPVELLTRAERDRRQARRRPRRPASRTGWSA